MKVVLFGKNSKEIKPLLIQKVCFELVKTSPDFVISYGGDGTFMQAEYAFPEIPKIILRGNNICKRCLPLSNEEVLSRVAKRKYKIESLIKLEAYTKHKTMTAVNDIIIHNRDARHAIRYHVWVNGNPIGNEIIGDGIVIATPFGSTAYYRSITDSFFEIGLGLAFNNSTEQSDHMVLKDDSVIKLKLSRGFADVFADNQKGSVGLEAGDEVIVKKSNKVSSIVIV